MRTYGTMTGLAADRAGANLTAGHRTPVGAACRATVHIVMAIHRGKRHVPLCCRGGGTMSAQCWAAQPHMQGEGPHPVQRPATRLTAQQHTPSTLMRWHPPKARPAPSLAAAGGCWDARGIAAKRVAALLQTSHPARDMRGIRIRDVVSWQACWKIKGGMHSLHHSQCLRAGGLLYVHVLQE